jgi:phospholipid/cholesterol/gamma-HCH transport system substrate-binding protein
MLTASIRDLLANLKALTAGDAALVASLANLQGVTEKAQGTAGRPRVFCSAAMPMRAGCSSARNALLARADALAAGLDRLVANADRQVFGQPAGPANDGNGAAQGSLVSRHPRATVNQLNGLLGEARSQPDNESMRCWSRRTAIASNTRARRRLTSARLRSEVEATLRKVQHLINEVNRRWPFARDNEIELP